MQHPAFEILAGQTPLVLVRAMNHPQTEEVRMGQFDDLLAYKPDLMLVSAGVGFLR